MWVSESACGCPWVSTLLELEGVAELALEALLQLHRAVQLAQRRLGQVVLVALGIVVQHEAKRLLDAKLEQRLPAFGAKTDGAKHDGAKRMARERMARNQDGAKMHGAITKELTRKALALKQLTRTLDTKRWRHKLMVREVAETVGVGVQDGELRGGGSCEDIGG
eukprot:5086419-Pleurochrysis_carterae.AAC.1